jgi:glycosyltransferase involved in cell wall biosynthesis
MALKITIVICTKNRRAALRDYSLRALEHPSYRDCEILVVTHPSMDGTEEMLRRMELERPTFRGIVIDGGAGLCGARNEGARQASGEVAVYLDDDAVPLETWLGEIQRQFETDPLLCVLGGPAYNRDSDIIENQDWIKGVNMAFRTNIFTRYSFDTNLRFLRSSAWDELDLIQRIKADGHTVRFSDKMAVRHYSQSGSHSRLAVGDAMNRAYARRKVTVSLASYYASLLYGILRFAVWPTPGTFKKLKASERGWFVEEGWKNLLWMRFYCECFGVTGPFRWFWLVFFKVPLLAQRQAAIERQIKTGQRPGIRG